MSEERKIGDNPVRDFLEALLDSPHALQVKCRCGRAHSWGERCPEERNLPKVEPGDSGGDEC